jgi:hypothetical protein
MRRGDRAFAIYLAALVVVVAFMAANKVVAAGSAIPSWLGAAIRSPDVTDRSAGHVPPSRVAGAFDQQGQ